MERSRSGPTGRSLDRTPVRWGLLLAAAILAAFFGPMPLGLTLGVPHGSPVDTPVGHGPSGESPQCAQINSNATLNSTYIGIYDGVNNWSQLPPGQNQSRPVNQSGYPPVATGEAELTAAWTFICGSAPYTALLAANGLTGLISGSQLNTSTGYFQLSYGFAFHASCSNPSDESSRACAYFTIWYVQWPNGNVSGPVTTAQGTPLGNPPSPAPSAGGSNPPLFSGSSGTTGYAWVGGGAVALALGTLVVVLALRRSHPSAGSGGTVTGNDPGRVPTLSGQAPGPASSPLSSDRARPTGSARVSEVSEEGGTDDPLGDIY